MFVVLSNMLQLYPHLQQSLIGDIVKLHPHTAFTLSLSTKAFHRREKCNQKEFLRQTIERGSKKLCQLAIESGSNLLDFMLITAAKFGDIDACRLAIERGANDFNGMLLHAARGGNIEICRWAIELGANAFNWMLNSAARGGSIEICRLALELGAKDFNWMLGGAVRGGHIE